MSYFKLTIGETGRNSLREEEAQLFTEDVKCFKELREAEEAIIERYGRMPNKHNKVYRGEGEVIGFLYSFWNRDYSHASKSWFQTDWVTITEVTEKPVLLN